MYTYIEVSSKISMPSFWQKYQELVGQLLEVDASVPLFYYPSEDEFRASTLGKIKYFEGKFKSFVLFHKEECVGVLEIMLEVELAHLCLLPSHTKPEVITCIQKAFHSCKAEKLRIMTSQKEVKDLLQKAGSTLAIHDVIQKLSREKIDLEDIALLADSKQQYIEKQGFSLQYYSVLEGDILTKYVKFHNEVIRDILVYDMENGEQAITSMALKEKSEQMGKRGGGLLYLILLDKEERIIGLTEVWMPNLKYCEYINSGLTAVKKEYRKRGIAQFLKAKMLQKLLHDFDSFSTLETANSVVNIPVLRLNEKFGFQKVSEEFMLDFSMSSRVV